MRTIVCTIGQLRTAMADIPGHSPIDVTVETRAHAGDDAIHHVMLNPNPRAPSTLSLRRSQRATSIGQLGAAIADLPDDTPVGCDEEEGVAILHSQRGVPDLWRFQGNRINSDTLENRRH